MLFSTFFVLFASEILGVGFGILPGLSFKNAWLYLVVGYLTISAVAQGGVVSARFPLFLVLFVLLIVYALLSWMVCTLVYGYYDSLPHFMTFKNALVDPFLLFAVFFFGCATSDDAIWLARRLCFVVALSSMLLLLDFLNVVPLGLVSTVGGRFDSGVGGANQYAAFLVFFILAMTPMVLSRPRSSFIAVGMVASLMLLLQTGSRGGLVGLIAGAMAMTFVLRRHIDLRNAFKIGGAALATLAVVAVAAYITNPEMLLGRFEDTRAANSIEGLSTGRIAVWLGALMSMSERPLSFLTGMGWDTFIYARIYYDPHNYYLYLLYSLGPIGLGLFLAYIVGVVRSVISALSIVDDTSKRYLLGFLYGLAGLLVSILFGHLYTPWFFICPYIGLMTRLAWLARNRPIAEELPEHAGRAIPALRVGP